MCVLCGSFLADPATFSALQLVYHPLLRQPNEPNISISEQQLILSHTEMADDEIDYNIVFPDAGTSGEHHFIVLCVHASASLAYAVTLSDEEDVKNAILLTVSLAR